MKNSDLDKLLRSVHPPVRTAEESAEFPQQVVRQLSRPAHHKEVFRGERVRIRWWAWGFAAACLAIGFLVGRFPEKAPMNPVAVSDKTPAQDYVKLFREVALLFPDRLRGVVWRGSEIELVLADYPERPASSPLLVQIWYGSESRSVITFSGQKLEIDGRSIEVLVGVDDHVIVLADHRVWTSQNPAEVVDGLRINAQILQAQL